MATARSVQLHVSDMSFAARLAEVFSGYGERPALELGLVSVTYTELWTQAAELAVSLAPRFADGGAVGFLPQRAVETYVTILAAIILRRPYVSLNMKFPLARQLKIARASDCRAIVADAATKDRQAELMAELGWGTEGPVATGTPIEALPCDPVYYMFTSGTTGEPKGVVVSGANVLAFLDAISAVVPLEPGTRCSHFFEHSFDVSVHDLFHTWLSGGVVCAMTEADGYNRVAFARERRIECWYSVPSVVAIASRSGWLTPGALPDLKLSLFAGEALPTSLARLWLATAPNSRGFNLYGPTEATVTIVGHAFDRAQLERLTTPTVPIGQPNPGSDVVIVAPDGTPVAAGGSGELWLGGPQVVPGYLHNPDEMARKFVNRTFPGHSPTRWYRSGDLVQQTPEHGIIYLGRIDDQVKIAGYRVELFDVEAALREAGGSADVAAVPWPLAADGASEGLVAFVARSTRTAEDIRDDCAIRLPTYMVPARIVMVDELPLNQNGKVDRGKLRKTYLETSDATARIAVFDATDSQSELIARWSKLFPGRTITPATSFAALDGDSLTYVNTMLATEEIVGPLDDGWVQESITQLARRANVASVGSYGLDAASLLRAIAVVFIVAEHVHAIPMLNGDLGPLMLVSGFLFGLLPFANYREHRDKRVLLQPLMQLVLIILVITIPQAILAWSPRKVYDLLLVDDIVSGWHRPAWFTHALVHLMLLFWGLVAVFEWVQARFRTKLDVSLTVVGVMLALGAVAGFVMPFVFPYFNDSDPYIDAWWRYEPLGQAFLFSSGVLIGFAHRQRLGTVGVGLVVVWALMSLVLHHPNDAAVTIVAALLLAYLPRIRVPAIVAKPIYSVADATLFIYLLQFPIMNSLNRMGIVLPPPVKVVLIVGLSITLWRGWLWSHMGYILQGVVRRSIIGSASRRRRA